ncbi:MAG: ribose-phosphate diphosphokinase, partial [Planctomycetota bacterium]
SHQIQGFFDIPMDHLYAAPVVIDYFQRLNLDNVAIASPDVGGIKMARAYAKRLNASLAVVDKRRHGPEETEVMNIIGDVKDKNVILVDDMISTGTSIAAAARACLEKGAKSVRLTATHPIFAAGAAEKILNSDIKECVVTDTIPYKGKKDKRINVLSVSKLLAEAIRRIHHSESISTMFD